MEKKYIPGFEETHSRLESLSILDCSTIEDIQAFIDGDYSWTTATFAEAADGSRIHDTIKIIDTETEPDWIPDC